MGTHFLPVNSVLLASGKGCGNPEFIHGDRILGIQFHPEFSMNIIEKIADQYGSEIKSGSFVQMPSAFIGKNALVKKAKLILFQVLDNMEDGFRRIQI